MLKYNRTVCMRERERERKMREMSQVGDKDNYIYAAGSVHAGGVAYGDLRSIFPERRSAK